MRAALNLTLPTLPGSNKRRLDKELIAGAIIAEGDRKRVEQVNRQSEIIGKSFDQGCELLMDQWFPDLPVLDSTNPTAALDIYKCDRPLDQLIEDVPVFATACLHTLEAIMAHPEGRKRLARASAVEKVKLMDAADERAKFDDFIEFRSTLCKLKWTLARLDTTEHVQDMVLGQRFLQTHDKGHAAL